MYATLTSDKDGDVLNTDTSDVINLTKLLKKKANSDFNAKYLVDSD